MTTGLYLVPQPHEPPDRRKKDAARKMKEGRKEGKKEGGREGKNE